MPNKSSNLSIESRYPISRHPKQRALTIVAQLKKIRKIIDIKQLDAHNLLVKRAEQIQKDLGECKRQLSELEGNISKLKDEAIIARYSEIDDRLMHHVHHAAYVLYLDIIAFELSVHFSFPAALRSDTEVLRDVVHTAMCVIGSDSFDDYLEFKQKVDSKTDYRVYIDPVRIKDKLLAKALKQLQEHPLYVDPKNGRDRILIVNFPNLSSDDFNSLHRGLRESEVEYGSPIVRFIMCDTKKIMFLFMRDFSGPKLDLHGLKIKKAMEYAEQYLHTRSHAGETTATLMPGWGKHSDGKRAVLKPQLHLYLAKLKRTAGSKIDGIADDPVNPGLIHVSLKKAPFQKHKLLGDLYA